MKKTFFTLILLVISSTYLFSAPNRDKSKPRLMKIPLSFLPSSEKEAEDEEEYEEEVAKKEKKYKRKQKAQARKKANSSNKNSKATPYKYLINSWEPYWIQSKELEPSRYLFFQTNIGVGFLYFSKVQGNLGGSPGELFRDNGSVPYRGRLTYNRTPIFEYLLGYRFAPYFRVAFSYQHQNAVSIRTKAIDSAIGTTSPNVRGPQALLSSNFAIDALMLKGYIEFPWPMVWKMMAYSPYLGAGVGFGWQSWTNNVWTGQSSNNGYSASQLYLRSKFSGNCVWGIDAGIKVQSARPQKEYSIYAGVKYNQWGQTKAIGRVRDQGALKFGLFKPFKIGVLYSFAPYLGFQWNIPNSSFKPLTKKIGNRYINTWAPFIANSNQLQADQSTFIQFNGGVGFLYFAGIKGNITMTPPNNRENMGQFPGKYSMRYNRTPVVEYLFGYRLSPWIKVAISKQSQSNVFVQTKMRPNVNGAILAVSRFQANLNLLAAAGKIYVEAPKAIVWKNLAYNIFISGGAGPSWQTWTRMGVAIMDQQNTAFAGRERGTGNFYPLRPKVIPNVFFLADVGVKIKNADPAVSFYMTAGCRYNYWGSTRNLGKITQQYPTFREGLFKPLNIKTLYSFVPYLGAQWNFENVYRCKFKRPYVIKKRNVQTWVPYFTRLRRLEKKHPLFVQVNTGVGFLYFERLRVNLAGEPSSNTMDIAGGANFEGPLSYNRTPLFEYLIGTRIFDWWNMVFSYQYQGEVAVSTPILPPENAVSGNSGFVAKGNQFSANFRTDSIMAKFYFNMPFSVVWKGLVSTPYIAPGVGVGWQSWTRADVARLGNLPALRIDAQMDQPINQKLSANLVWTIDVGLRTSAAFPNPRFSSTMGVKYIDWGQALSMGQSGDQRGSSLSLFKPFKVRMVYSFAPYFGIQWNF